MQGFRRVGKNDGLPFAFGFVVGCLWFSMFYFFFINKITVVEYSYQQLATTNTTNSTTTKIKMEPSNNLHDYNGLATIDHSQFYPDDPTICIIIRTYKRHRTRLPALISTLASNDYPNMHIYLVDTQDDFEGLPNLPPLFNSLYNRNFVHTTNITKKYARERFPEFTKPDFGYLQTDLMIEQLSAPNHPHQCSYFIATNGDNLYGSDLMLHTVQYLRDQYSIVAFHFLSHYCYEDSEYFRPRPGCYSQHYTEFHLQRIDLGAAMFSKKRMLETNNNFILNELKLDPKGKNIEVYFLDGYFFERFARADKKNIILNATLFIHQ